MAGSSSANENTSSSLMLKIKQNQNMIIDLHSSKYNEALQPMIECLKFSRISKALTASEEVPIMYLSSAYSSAFYNKADDVVTFEVGSIKTRISKSRFGKLLGFADQTDLIDPESLSPSTLPRLFYQLGYKGDITQLSKFTKKSLPPLWNFLFTILFKSFSERTTGTNSASKLFYSLFYGLYHDINLDYGSILWSQFVESVNYKNRHSEISCARFWTVVVKRAIEQHHLHIMTDSVLAVIPTLSTTQFATTKSEDFDFIGSIPITMLDRVPNGVNCIAAYRQIPPSGIRDVDQTHQVAFDRLENPKKNVKRKGKTAVSDTEKQPKRPRRLRKFVQSYDSENELSDSHPIPTPPRDVPIADNLDDNPPPNPSPPQSPPHDPTPKTTPHSSPQSTPDHSPLRPTNTQKSPSLSPKQTSIPHSPLNNPPTDIDEDDDILVNDDQDDLSDFLESPSNVKLKTPSSSVPMSSDQLSEISAKLDLLLQSQANPSASDWQSQLKDHKDSVETLVTENVNLMGKITCLIEKSEVQMRDSTTSIGRLEKDVLKFTQDFRDAHDRNTQNMQQVISSFSTSLKTEKEALSTLRSELKQQYSEWVSSMDTKVDQLRADLASENYLMDKLAAKETKIQLLKTDLRHQSAILTSALSQNKAIRSGVSEIDSFLHRIVEDSDPILTPQVRRHLTLKLHPVFNLLAALKGVSEGVASPKQGGDDIHEESIFNQESPKKDTPIESNKNAEGVTGPSKDKGKKIVEEDESNQNATKSVRETEVDEILNLTRKLDAEEAAKREAELLLQTQMSLFPPWHYKRMTMEAITEPVENWLQPIASYNTSNDVNSQFDFPMTAKALLFRGFEELKHTRLSSSEVNDLLFTFYLKNARPQHLTWSLKKIVQLTPRLPEVTLPFINSRLLAFRGDDKEKMEFSLADLPFMNPFDWISLFNILSREQKYYPIFNHVKRMIGFYILEVAKLDVEVAGVLDKAPLTVRRPPPKNLGKRKIGKIANSNWSVAYNSKEGLENVKRIFFLLDKHLYRTPVLEHILHIINKLPSNTTEDKTCVNDMLRWYIEFRKRILAIIPKVFDRQTSEVKLEE
ncbi:hypothetical protein L2E82_15997 [Cichorium intybus]|uniref:Uncharacterized protein n=1 Tax=Cichorium intybus TaxID=13427 RepID=A0ACB9F4W6_CICIN|nr:hypothetical protein L2E82_15997 [Cichorium intybus]